MTAFKFFRKGFSPLVATILLTAFSVALTTVIISWREPFIGDYYDVCSGINLKIEVFEDKQFCYSILPDGIQSNFIIKNIHRIKTVGDMVDVI